MDAITVVEAEENGVSMEMVRVCREIRRLAMLDRISLDESEHRSGLNRHLFSYIEYCGMDVREYIKGYLSNLQPYMIERFKSQEPGNNFICVLDNMYRVSVYIKIDKTFGREIIVSFHESNKRGIAKENYIATYGNDSLVPVIADEICARIDGSPKVEVKVFIQRGMLSLPIRVMGQICENGVYIVYARDIETPIIEQCNQYLRDLYTSDLDLNALDSVELFSVLHQISFTSYGNTVFSNISLLIDNMALQRGVIGKKTADFALVTYVGHLVLDSQQADELISMLEEKYKVSSQRGIDLIVERIKDGLQNGSQIGIETKDDVLENTTKHKRR
jgi:hypothetical protein